MPTLILETLINASPEVCFDLVRNVHIHQDMTADAGEQPVGGGIDGIIGLGQSVAFEGKHFGFRQRLTVEVVEFDRPRLFVDEMTEGAFRSFRHHHEFLATHGGTLMRDTLIWRSPFGLAGRMFDRFVLERHLSRLVTKRNAQLKEIAESAERKAPEPGGDAATTKSNSL